MTTFNLKKIQLISNYCQTRIIWCVYISQPTKIFDHVQFEENKEHSRFNENKVKLINERGRPQAKDYTKLE